MSKLERLIRSASDEDLWGAIQFLDEGCREVRQFHAPTFFNWTDIRNMRHRELLCWQELARR
jgi:hypothetical protein